MEAILIDKQGRVDEVLEVEEQHLADHVEFNGKTYKKAGRDQHNDVIYLEE